MITSCAPTPFILSKRPSPSRSRSPSMPSAGKRFGTTRIFQPGLFAPPPLRPYTRISGGVLPSAPGQNGQFFGPVSRTLSRRKSVGRFPRSVEMITQRPVMGSLRNSGKASLLENGAGRIVRGKSRREKRVNLRATRNLLLECSFGAWIDAGKAAARPPHSISELRAEGVFVQADFGRVAGLIVDCQDIEAAGVGADVTFGDETLRGADYD